MKSYFLRLFELKFELVNTICDLLEPIKVIEWNEEEETPCITSRYHGDCDIRKIELNGNIFYVNDNGTRCITNLDVLNVDDLAAIESAIREKLNPTE